MPFDRLAYVVRCRGVACSAAGVGSGKGRYAGRRCRTVRHYRHRCHGPQAVGIVAGCADVDFGGLRVKPETDKKPDDDGVALAAGRGQRRALRAQEDGAVARPFHQTFAGQAVQHLGHGRGGYAHARGDVDRARLAHRVDQFGDQFHVILCHLIAMRIADRLEPFCPRFHAGAVGGGGRAVESWQDRRIGKEVAQQREATVEQKRAEPMEPVFIEQAAPAVAPVSRKAAQRKEREKQAPLFPEAIVGGTLPPLSLLDAALPPTDMPTEETLQFTSRLIETRLGDFGVEVKVIAAYPGPVITRYEIEPDVGVKGSQIVNLARDLARALALVSVRVVETVPGKSCMALELPNPKRQTVRLSEILSSRPYHNMSSPLTVALGKDIGGQPIVADLAKMPHLLVAGTTGSGKSVGVNAMILSMLYKAEPDSVRLILVDPKMLELSIYEGIPHLLAPVVTDMRQAANALSWCVAEMERRYKVMSKLGVRNLASANEHIQKAAEKGEPIPNPLTLTPESPEPLRSMPGCQVGHGRSRVFLCHWRALQRQRVHPVVLRRWFYNNWSSFEVAIRKFYEFIEYL